MKTGNWREWTQEELEVAREQYALGFRYLVQFEEGSTFVQAPWTECGSPVYFKCFDDMHSCQAQLSGAKDVRVKWLVFLNEVKG